MAKRKPNKRKYTVVRTGTIAASAMNTKTKKAVAGVAGALAVLLAGAGFSMIPNPALGYLLVGASALLGWFALVEMEWFRLLARKYVQYPGYAVIAVASMLLVLFLPHEKPDVPKDTNDIIAASPPVPTNVQDTPGSSVTSHGQTGGITAQTVTAGNITINNYFGNQTADEKEKWRQYLTDNYPLGWCLFATDGKETYTPRGLSYEKNLAVRWGTERVFALTPDVVALQWPDFLDRRTLTLFTGCGVGVERKVGSVAKSVLGQTAIIVELLKDEGDFVVAAIGFRETNESDRLPQPSGSQRVPAKTAP